MDLRFSLKVLYFLNQWLKHKKKNSNSKTQILLKVLYLYKNNNLTHIPTYINAKYRFSLKVLYLYIYEQHV
jgi:hypothetical protein